MEIIKPMSKNMASIKGAVSWKEDDDEDLDDDDDDDDGQDADEEA